MVNQKRIEGVYNLNGYDDEDIIKWNSMNSKIDETFNEAING